MTAEESAPPGTRVKIIEAYDDQKNMEDHMGIILRWRNVAFDELDQLVLVEDDADTLEIEQFHTPEIKVDQNIIYGCECWWITEADERNINNEIHRTEGRRP